MPYPRIMILALAALLCSCSDDSNGTPDQDAGSDGAGSGETIRIAQFNIREFTTAKILDEQNLQASSAAKIIARFNADIVCINEIQYDIKDTPTAGLPGASSSSIELGGFDNGAENARRMADRVRKVDPKVDYTETITVLGNSGVRWQGETYGKDYYYLRGWGEFAGRFNTAVLSRYPILKDQVQVIHDVPWEDIPESKIAQFKKDTGSDVPAGFPLFEKSINVVPIKVGEEVLYLVLHHPLAPVYWEVDPYRHFDELKALKLFLDGTLTGTSPLPEGAKFLIVGDLNADPEDGDSMPGGIDQVLGHPLITQHFPEGAGTKGTHGERNTYLSGCGRDDGATVDDPAQKFQLQLDYLLPSKTITKIEGSAIFWPDHVKEKADFDLACWASDHRFLYIDLTL